MSQPVIDAEESAAIVAAYRQRMADWQPRSLQAQGCLTLIVAVLLFGASGALVRAAGWPGWVEVVLSGVAVLAGIIGFFVMGARVVQESPEKRTEQAIIALGSGTPLDDATRRGHAVALLFHAFDVHGPTMRSSFDFEAARTRLGAALPYVLAVERVLDEAGLVGAYTVFLPRPAPPAPAATPDPPNPRDPPD